MDQNARDDLRMQAQKRLTFGPSPFLEVDCVDLLWLIDAADDTEEIRERWEDALDDLASAKEAIEIRDTRIEDLEMALEDLEEEEDAP
jgi:hypothetical protein